jgi:hypothetical protein
LAFVLELIVEADYGQIYVYDPETQADMPDDLYEDQLERASDDADTSRRFVGYDRGLVDILTPSQFNWKMPMRIEVWEDAPPLDLDAWDHVAEVPLPVPSGTLCFQASGGGEPIEAQIPAGNYRVRVSGQGFIAGVGEIEGAEKYRLQLWPSDDAQAALVKYWQGYDLMRPKE